MEENDSLRYKLYQQADQLMINDAPVVPLWYDSSEAGATPCKGSRRILNLLELRRAIIFELENHIPFKIVITLHFHLLDLYDCYCINVNAYYFRTASKKQVDFVDDHNSTL
jgi:hypothetical protein